MKLLLWPKTRISAKEVLIVGRWRNMIYFDWTRGRINYLIGQDNRVAREKEGCGREIMR